jgi:hypothetical protein
MALTRERRKKDQLEDIGSVGIFWLACDSCGGWEVYENTGLPGPYVEKTAKRAKFNCRMCNLIKKQEATLSEITALKERLSSVEAAQGKTDKSLVEVTKSIPADIKATQEIVKCSNQKLVDDVATMKAEVAEIAQSQQTRNTTLVNTLTPMQLRQATDEVTEVEKRKLNLIVAGLPDRNSDVQDLLNFCNKSHLLSAPIREDYIMSAERVGRRNDGQSTSRLLRIRLKTAEVRRSILTMYSKRIASDDYPPVYVRPDLTRAQQSEDKKLRDELLSKGKDKYKIHRGKIVERNYDSTASSEPCSQQQKSGSSSLASQPASGSQQQKPISNNPASQPAPNIQQHKSGSNDPSSQPTSNYQQQQLVNSNAKSPSVPDIQQQKTVDSKATSQSEPVSQQQKTVDSKATSQSEPVNQQQMAVDSKATSQSALVSQQQKAVDSKATTQSEPVSLQQKAVDSKAITQPAPDSLQQKAVDSNGASQPALVNQQPKAVDSNATSQPAPGSQQQKSVDSNALYQPASGSQQISAKDNHETLPVILESKTPGI